MSPDPTWAINQVQKLAPRWAARAAEADRAGRIAPETADEISEIGAHRLLQPQRFGGAEATIAAHVRIVAAAAEGCASTAWCLAVWSVHNWMLSLFGPEAQEEIWGSDPAARISASIVPRTEFSLDPAGGLRVGGRFPFASGCDHASWFGLGGRVPRDDGSEDRVITMVPAAAVTIDHGSWAVMGLRGSGSKDITVAAGQPVPAHRSLSVPAAVRGQAPGQRPDGASLPFTPFRGTAALVLAPPALGVARAAARRFLDRAGTHRIGFAGVVQKNDPAAALRVAESTAEIDAAELVMDRAARRLDDLATERRLPSPLETATVLRDTAFAVRLCAQAVDRLYEASGGSALADDEPMQRHWRDVHAARSHAVLTWDNAANEYGTAAMADLPD